MTVFSNSRVLVRNLLLNYEVWSNLVEVRLFKWKTFLTKLLPVFGYFSTNLTERNQKKSRTSISLIFLRNKTWFLSFLACSFLLNKNKITENLQQKWNNKACKQKWRCWVNDTVLFTLLLASFFHSFNSCSYSACLSWYSTSYSSLKNNSSNVSHSTGW